MIVVDVNAVAYLWLPGEHTALAERVLAKDANWVAPILWRSELRNVLAGYLRRRSLSVSAASRCLDGAETQFAGHEYLVPSTRVMALVAQSTCSAYDCEYVALAADLHVPLVTADREILAQFPKLATSLKDFAAAV